MRPSDSTVRFHIVDRWDHGAKDLLATRRDFGQPEMIARIVWEPYESNRDYAEEHVLFRQTRIDGHDSLPLCLMTLAAELDRAGIMTTGHAQEVKVLRGWLEDMRTLALAGGKP